MRGTEYIIRVLKEEIPELTFKTEYDAAVLNVGAKPMCFVYEAQAEYSEGCVIRKIHFDFLCGTKRKNIIPEYMARIIEVIEKEEFSVLSLTRGQSAGNFRVTLIPCTLEIKELTGDCPCEHGEVYL
ncbi:MAG: hypothetical protein Q4C42_04535 [Clostridia bacterium]|nr:hypothetical protein [Clostridia bacterium]